jgi:hypothetical protein
LYQYLRVFEVFNHLREIALAALRDTATLRGMVRFIPNALPAEKEPIRVQLLLVQEFVMMKQTRSKMLR